MHQSVSQCDLDHLLVKALTFNCFLSEYSLIGSLAVVFTCALIAYICEFVVYFLCVEIPTELYYYYIYWMIDKTVPSFYIVPTHMCLFRWDGNPCVELIASWPLPRPDKRVPLI